MAEKKLEKITKDSLIGDIMACGPNTTDVLSEYFGGACVTCGGRFLETLEMGLTSHGLEKELPGVLAKLEKAFAEDKKQ